MLTQDQKLKLEPLTHHEKYGKLLIEAMRSWETIRPERRCFGIDLKESNTWGLYKFVNKFANKCCCLIGAALLDKKSNVNHYVASAVDIYSVLPNEIENLIGGFDQDSSFSSSEAYDFGRQVSEIIFGEIH